MRLLYEPLVSCRRFRSRSRGRSLPPFRVLFIAFPPSQVDFFPPDVAVSAVAFFRSFYRLAARRVFSARAVVLPFCPLHDFFLLPVISLLYTLTSLSDAPSCRPLPSFTLPESVR